MEVNVRFFFFKETIHKGSTSKVTSVKEESTMVCPSVFTLRAQPVIYGPKKGASRGAAILK